MNMANENNGKISEHSKGLGTVTREMVEKRAREVAFINGRSADQVTESDRAEAKRELEGMERTPAVDEDAEVAADRQPWDPAPASSGHQEPKETADDEQTVAERLTKDGMAEAEHDQMVEGTRESIKRDHGD